MILIGSQNSTGISYGIPGVPVGVKNIDYIPAALKPEGKEKELLFLYQSLGVAKWQHMIMLETIVRLGQNWNIPILWINGTSDGPEEMSEESTYNYVDNLRLIHQYIPGVGVTLPAEPEEALKVMSETILKPMQDQEPPPGLTLDDVGRDLLHPGAKCHLDLAEKIEYELDGFGTLNY